MACNRFRLASLATILSAAIVVAPAQRLMAQPQALHAGTVEVPVNKSQVISTDRVIARAMIGSADIADVLPITDRSVYLLGKKMGTTSLTLYDAAGRVISIMDVAVGPDVIALSDQLAELVPGEKIDARISNEAIVLTGVVNSAGAADRAAQIARAFAGDKVINLISMGSSQQIMLEVRFAEVSRSVGKDIGVRLSGSSRNGRFDGISGTGAGWVPGTPGTTQTTIDSNGNATTSVSGQILPYLGFTAINDSFGIFRQRFGIGNLDITSMINALETRGLAKTLAQPTLVALSGEKASFLAGGEFPVPVQQTNNGSGSGTGGITIGFKPFGVSLAFTPTLLGDKTISLMVEPEVSAIDNNASVRIGDILIPGLRTRRASTTVELRDGESFAIAGLLQRDFDTTVEQVPLLGSIPIIGSLFRSAGFRKGETELLIVVTPRLVAPIRPDQVRLPTDRVLDPREGDTFLLGQPYRPAPVAPATPATPAASTGATAATPAAKKDDGYAY